MGIEIGYGAIRYDWIKNGKDKAYEVRKAAVDPSLFFNEFTGVWNFDSENTAS